MTQNKDRYSFTEPDDPLENMSGAPAGTEPEAAVESNLPYKTIAHIIIAVICILFTLIISKSNSPWAGWTRTRLHTAINASAQHTFGYISNTPFFKSLIMNGSRLIKLEEIRKLSAGKFPTGTPLKSDVFDDAVWPVQGNISRSFGWQEDHTTQIRQFNPGVEFITQKNTDVWAIAAGEVAAVKFNRSGGGEVVIDHGGGWRSIYRGVTNIKVESGWVVKAGTIIAQTAADKITLELRHQQEPVDPLTVIRN